MTLRTEDRRAHAYDRLPFVTSSTTGPRDFWAPRPTGDYSYDCSLGEQYAEAALPFLRDRDDHLLNYLVLAMIDHADRQRDRGVIVGFMSRIGRELSRPALTLVRAA